MTEQEVVALMKSSKTQSEWNANCDKVKAAFADKPDERSGDYPSFWYKAIVMSGIAAKASGRFF